MSSAIDDDPTEAAGVGGVGGGKRAGGGNSKYHRTIQSDGTYLTLRHAFGVEGCIRDNVAFVTVPDPDADGGGLLLGYLVHPVGQQVALHRVDDGSMKFLVHRQKNVREILALCVSPNKRVIAVCERGRAPDEDPGSAQVSIYHVVNCKRIRTMLFPGRGDFVTCCFSGDNKWLVTAGTDLESNIVVWNWDKEKVDRTAQNHGFNATRVAFDPGDPSFLTTSGPSHLRLWYASSDNVLKAHAILPQAREQENFADHTWISGTAGQPTRMVAITDGEGGLGATGAHGQREASVLVFDSMDGPPFLELKQTLHAPLPLASRLETLMAFSKGFIVAGGGINGYLGVYENMDDIRDPYMLIKSFSSKGAVLAGLTLNRNSEMLYAYSKSNELLTFNLGNMDVLDDDGNHFHTLLQGGNHTAPVVAVDACLTKPIVVTVGEDRVLRIWSYLKWKCEVVHEFRNEDPNSASLHPAGYQVAIGFKDRIRMYSVLMEGLRLLRDIPQKNCRAVCYAHGGHLLAVASGFSVIVYSSITSQQVHNFTGHIAAITLVRWGPRDNLLFSTGQDGNVYGWDLQSGARVDDCVALNRPHGYHAMAMRLSDKREVADVVAVCGTESLIREMTWGGSLHKEHIVRDVRIDGNKQDEAVFITCMATSTTGKNLFCGTNTGRVRVYDWPLPQDLPARCVELPVHSGSVSDLVVTPDDNFLFTCGEDGSVFALGIKVMERGIQIKGADDPDPRAFDVDGVLVSQEEIEEQFGQVAELNKAMEDMKSEHAFALHRKTAELLDELKQASEEHEGQLAGKDSRFEDLHQKHESMKRENVEELDKKDRHHVQVTQELENQYEHRLAVELDRYDRLSEEVEAVQQRCEGLLEAQQQEHEWELRAREQAARKMEKELRLQIERLQEDKNYNDQMYKEVLDQQEAEYETELQQLTAAAEAELHGERENTGKLRATLQTRKTKEDQLRKKMQETQRSSSAREMMFALEKAKRERLEATMHHFEQHMHQRELTLAEKEKTILELRSNNTTLDNFRFVLDHRLQQLMEERGPITAHIEGLEAHIRGMYDELVSEFGEKKEVARVLEQKELKVAGLTQEVNGLRSMIRGKDRVIFGFKRELSSMVHIGLPKDLEQAVKDAYKRFVQGEEAPPKAPRGRKAGGTSSDRGPGGGGADSGGGGAGIGSKGSGADGKDKSGGGGGAGKGKGGTAGDDTELSDADDALKGGGMDADGDSDGSCESGDFHRGGGGGRGRRGRGGGDDAADLMAQTLEAHRQREFMEKKQNELRAKLSDAKLVALKQQRAKLNENSALISECNSLRKENNNLKRKNEILQLEAKEMAARPAPSVRQHQPRPGPAKAGPGGATTAGVMGTERRRRGSIERGDASLDGAGSLSVNSPSGADSTSITVMHAPETGSPSSFPSAPPQWDPVTKAGTAGRAGGGAANDVTGQRQLLNAKVGNGNDIQVNINGTLTAPASEQQLNVQGQSRQSSSLLSSSASLNLLLQPSQHRPKNKPLSRRQHQALGGGSGGRIHAAAGAGGVLLSAPGRSRASTGGLTPVSSTPRLMKGGTRDLYAQAALTGGTLRLERALDEKERELQIQHAETSALRERLRALEGSGSFNSSANNQGGLGRGNINDTNNNSKTVNRSRGLMNTPPPSLLGAPWAGRGSGTAPYSDPDGSRPVSPDGWAMDAPVRSGSANRSTRQVEDGGGNAKLSLGIGRPVGGGNNSGAERGGPVGPPGAHSAILRPPRGYQGGDELGLDQDLIVSSAGVRTGGDT